MTVISVGTTCRLADDGHLAHFLCKQVGSLICVQVLALVSAQVRPAIRPRGLAVSDAESTLRFPSSMVTPRRAPIEEAERREAHNACSRRSYAKNRLSINQRCRDTYHRQKTHPSKANRPLEPLIRKAARLVDIEVNSGHSHTQRSSELAEAMDQVERLSARFRIITSGSPKRHACIIYKEYARTMTEDHPKGCRSLINNAVLEISSLEQSLQEYENVILNYAGVGKEMKRYRSVWEPIQRLVCWLEEMLCEAMISPEGLREKYDRRELAFRALNQD